MSSKLIDYRGSLQAFSTHTLHVCMHLMERKTLGFLFLLFLVLAADVAVKTAEARDCSSKSHGFKGACFSDTNCAQVCRNEGFTGGKCTGFRHRCFCTRIC
ncbi:Defensin protein 4 [Spatholobus suberectus]|nr:Defensin protein 4 [Spatholobus suberectus]